MADNDLSDKFSKFSNPAAQKFHRIWEKEADMADDLEMSVNWYKKWSDNRDAYAAKNDTARADSCQGLVDFWDARLVKIAGYLAEHKEYVASGKDPLIAEFNQKKLTLLGPIYDALSTLDDTQIKSGKAIFTAMLPMMEEEPTPAPKANPLDKGNPFKKNDGPKV